MSSEKGLEEERMQWLKWNDLKDYWGEGAGPVLSKNWVVSWCLNLNLLFLSVVLGINGFWTPKVVIAVTKDLGSQTSMSLGPSPIFPVLLSLLFCRSPAVSDLLWS